MAPPSAATAAPARGHSAGAASSPSRRKGRGAATPATRRPPLRVVPGRSRTRSAPRPTRAPLARGRLLTIMSVSMVVAALLAVVVGQALLANGQVRLSTLQHDLALEQSAHRQSELAVAELETPSRIVAAALGQLHMVRPADVVELPYVSLSIPVPTPKVTPAPAPPVTATTVTAETGSGAGGSGASGASGASATGGSSTTTATSTP